MGRAVDRIQVARQGHSTRRDHWRAAVKIANDNTAFIGGAWGPDDNIILAIGGRDTALYRASADGVGTPDRLTTPANDAGQGTYYTAPSLLPSGKAVVFYILRLQGQTETIRLSISKHVR